MRNPYGTSGTKQAFTTPVGIATALITGVACVMLVVLDMLARLKDK